MENKSTIDGVSRDTIQRAIDVIQQVGYQDKFIDYDLTRNVQVELRALLDAPAVERQEPYGLASVLIDTFRFAIDNGKQPTFSKGDLLWLIEQLSKAQSESIALQATIARLQARIAELESGRGEPVAFIQIPKNVEKYGHADQADRLRFGKPGQFFVDGKSPMFDFIPLYTAPPAPVAVKLEMAHVVRAHMEIPNCPVMTSNQCHALAVKLNAFLDATAALNNKNK